MFSGQASPQAQISQSGLNPRCGPIAIRSVTVQGKPVSMRPGDGVKVAGTSENIIFRFGPITNEGVAPIRLRYRLEGYEHNWHEGDCEMFLAVRYFDEHGDQIGQVPFNASGESAGW